MKFSCLFVATIPMMASAFVVAPQRQPSIVSMSAATKAAKSAEEDLELTRKVIKEFMGESSEDSAPAPSPAPKEEAPKEE